jgi:hypothetical protein
MAIRIIVDFVVPFLLLININMYRISTQQADQLATWHIAKQQMSLNNFLQLHRRSNDRD